MLVRALALLLLVASASIALSWAFGAEVLAAVGLMLQQAKILFAKAFALSWQSIMVWLKAQGINFARVEIAKRWFLKSILPLILGAAAQRRLAEFLTAFKAGLKTRYDAMMGWYAALPLPVKVIGVLIVMFATLGLAIVSTSLWLLIFSVQLPLWIAAMFGTVGGMIWRYVQKLAFRTIAFMKLYQLWGWMKRRIPQSYLVRKRRFDFRVARIVVKRRKMTLAQLETSKSSLALRWALMREYFRHRRPDAPTEAEYATNRARREAEDRATEPAE